MRPARRAIVFVIVLIVVMTFILAVAIVVVTVVPISIAVARTRPILITGESVLWTTGWTVGFSGESALLATGRSVIGPPSTPAPAAPVEAPSPTPPRVAESAPPSSSSWMMKRPTPSASWRLVMLNYRLFRLKVRNRVSVDGRLCAIPCPQYSKFTS